MTPTPKLPVGLILIIILEAISALASLAIVIIPRLPFQIIGSVLFVTFILITIGLFKLNNLARLTIVWIYSIGIAFNIFSFANRPFSIDLSAVVRCFIEIVVVFYLTRPKIISLFKPDVRETGTGIPVSL